MYIQCCQLCFLILYCVFILNTFNARLILRPQKGICIFYVFFCLEKQNKKGATEFNLIQSLYK